MKLFFITGILMIFFISGFFISEAYAYIDPGSASLFIQVIVGALVGVGIKEKIIRIRKKNE